MSSNFNKVVRILFNWQLKKAIQNKKKLGVPVNPSKEGTHEFCVNLALEDIDGLV